MLKKLTSLFNKSSGDFNRLDKEIVEEYNSQRPLGAKPILCYAPLTSMRFERDGKVIACCYNNKNEYGKYPEQSIMEIWKGAGIKKLRNHIKNDDLTAGCQACKTNLENRQFNLASLTKYDTFPVNKNYPSMLEFKLDNTCNLECVMCRGENSSLIRKNREKLPPLSNPFDDEFVNQLREFIPHLTEAKFSGGEPFLIDIYYKIWREIIRINPNCRITSQTNGTVLNDRVKAILNEGRFNLSVSVDSITKENYEIIRQNSSFDIIMQNLEYFAEYSKENDSGLGVTFCPMRSNWKELPECIALGNRLNAEVWFNVVYYPMNMALWPLSSTELKEIKDYLTDHDLPQNTQLEKHNRRHYLEFIRFVDEWYEKALLRESEKTEAKLVLRESMETIREQIRAILEIDKTLTVEEKDFRFKTIESKVERVLIRTNDTKISPADLQFASHLFADELMLKTFEDEPEESIIENINALAS